MKKSRLIEEIIEDSRSSPSAPCIGRLAGTNKQGDILVKYGNHGPQPAKLIAAVARNELVKRENRSRDVLLVFEKGDPYQPVIIGLMEDPLDSLVSLNLSSEETQQVKEVLVDGKRITIEAEDEVMLKCGKASILIRKDGKIIIKGTNLLSRSSGTHRIKGARVDIN